MKLRLCGDWRLCAKPDCFAGLVSRKEAKTRKDAKQRVDR
jgi:hypothetical protein